MGTRAHDDQVVDDRRAEVVGSPVHRAVWDASVPMELFESRPLEVPSSVQAIMDRSLAVVRAARDAGSLYGPDGMVADDLRSALAVAGYWGLRIPAAHGGAGASFSQTVAFVAELAVVDPYVAGMMSTHAFLGPGETVQAFGTEAQQRRLLPALSRGDRLGAFAVTEPGSSADWSALTTTARRTPDGLRLTGEKLFITNAGTGRTIGLLCWLDGRHEFLVVEAPDVESTRFRVVTYPMHAPGHVANTGLVFDDLPVPDDAVLQPAHGDGRAIAYHALNRGRVGVSAFAAGGLRTIAGSLVPWVQQRTTFGVAIAERELVQRRLGQLAGSIATCDALLAWCGELLDQGHRGELEAVATKVVASELLLDATLGVLLRTQGARSFLGGTLFADRVHDLVAPTIYEGENDLLTIGAFHALQRDHIRRYLDPLATARRGDGRTATERVRATASAGLPYARWLATRAAAQATTRAQHPFGAPAGLEALADVALAHLRRVGLDISGALRRHGAGMDERQTDALELARRAQLATAMLVVSRWAARQEDPAAVLAGRCGAASLDQRLAGRRPTEGERHDVVELGALMAHDECSLVTADVARPPVPLAGPLLVAVSDLETLRSSST